MPYDERDDEEKFTSTYPESAFLDAIRSEHNPTTGDIAEAVGCTQQNAWYRLDQLRELGIVTSEKVGNANVWKIV